MTDDTAYYVNSRICMYDYLYYQWNIYHLME